MAADGQITQEIGGNIHTDGGGVDLEKVLTDLQYCVTCFTQAEMIDCLMVGEDGGDGCSRASKKIRIPQLADEELLRQLTKYKAFSDALYVEQSSQVAPIEFTVDDQTVTCHAVMMGSTVFGATLILLEDDWFERLANKLRLWLEQAAHDFNENTNEHTSLREMTETLNKEHDESGRAIPTKKRVLQVAKKFTKDFSDHRTNRYIRLALLVLAGLPAIGYAIESQINYGTLKFWKTAPFRDLHSEAEEKLGKSPKTLCAG